MSFISLGTESHLYNVYSLGGMSRTYRSHYRVIHQSQTAHSVEPEPARTSWNKPEPAGYNVSDSYCTLDTIVGPFDVQSDDINRVLYSFQRREFN